MIITISGTIGSGKSTLAKRLAEKLGVSYHYSGGLRREMARKRGITLHELNALGETEDWTDKEVDELQKQIGETQSTGVVEGRTAFYFIPHSLKVCITVDEKVGAERIWKDIENNPEKRNEAQNLNSLDDVMNVNRERVKSDKIRYRKYYDIDVTDPKHYDFILDTTTIGVEEAFGKLYEFVEKKLRGTPS